MKKQLTIIIMKKTLFSLLSLMGLTFPAFAQSHINIELLDATYTTPAVQFRISWNSIPSVASETHNSKIWLWVDFIKTENNQPSGSWTRATVGTISGGTTSYDGSNRKGFWLQGNTGSYNQIVTVALTNIPTNTTFNWCAYASDCPPNAASYNSGSYTFKGTKPFIINGTSVNDNKYAVTKITSLTDATGCPGGIGRDVQDNGGNCLPGLTAVGGYCRDLVADGASTYIGCNVEVENFNRGWDIWNYYCPPGWELPTHAQIKCMFNNKEALGMTRPLPLQNTFFFRNHDGTCDDASWHCSNDIPVDIYIMFFSGLNCTDTMNPPPGSCAQVRNTNGGYWRCVR
jgi:hypothetical protein